MGVDAILEDRLGMVEESPPWPTPGWGIHPVAEMNLAPFRPRNAIIRSRGIMRKTTKKGWATRPLAVSLTFC